ncbi:Methyltransferase type 11 [Candidatus Promineifilum breve]|uniref:Methyltransferase type 11 n=1 Tax=Candidatus Promineifilum breve TaxID=1806508 RepID=A0A160T0L8_9CHLR|nr:class I SAM-dependent methyltransferase [Candidatus Promineifilum breve]CUS02629.2 Methyltransferase type 11 [Candidatus Promineifilum breve]
MLYSPMMYEQIIDSLRQAYDNHAAQRDAAGLTDWKVAERADFLALLQAEGKRDLLEIGGGPGHHAAWFREQGLAVVMTDLSPEMVRLARLKGVDARVMDFLNLAFPPASFDAVFALNCLLHVPSADLPRVLAAIHRLLRPGGLLFYGVYGGYSFEGIFADDHHDPARYFVFYPDDELRQQVATLFDEVTFRAIPLEEEEKAHFQALTLRRRERA